jgi:hypothetical protein
MRAEQDFDPADDSESETFAFDFALRLNNGETVVTTSWEIKLLGGIDDNPTSRLIGAPVMVGTESRQRVGNLLVGCTYELTATVTTSQGDTLSGVGVVTCES